MPDQDDQLLTVPDVAKRMQVGEETIRRWLRSRELAGFHLGRGSSWRVKRSDLDAFIESRRMTGD
jgi:excisionase family DNA binding protein